MKKFVPEGFLLETPENKNALRSQNTLNEACRTGQILEARTSLCDSAHNLWVNLGCMQGMIPRHEGAIGLDDGSVRDIALISRVNKPVCFRITGFEQDETGRTFALLSRRAVQLECRAEYIQRLIPGDIIDAKITHLEYFGAFADIGCGITSLLPIDAISVSRLSHPRDRFVPGDTIRAIVKDFDVAGRISLSHKELLGTWEENAAGFKAGETVAGIVRSVENYGIFVELTPNLAGLAEPHEDVYAGQQTSVYIKSLIPSRMKIKLIIVDAFDAKYAKAPIHYFYQADFMASWRYSPEGSEKVIETIFQKDLP